MLLTEDVGEERTLSRSLDGLRGSFFSDWDLLTSLDFNFDKLFLWTFSSTLSDSGEAMGAGAVDFLGLLSAEPESVSSM